MSTTPQPTAQAMRAARAIADLISSGEKISLLIPRIAVLVDASTNLPELLSVLNRLIDAAEAHAADQSEAPHPMVGLTQPITAAEGKELCDAIEAARVCLAKCQPNQGEAKP